MSAPYPKPKLVLVDASHGTAVGWVRGLAFFPEDDPVMVHLWWAVPGSGPWRHYGPPMTPLEAFEFGVEDPGFYFATVSGARGESRPSDLQVVHDVIES